MSKEIFISSTPHETRLAIVENDALTEIYYERENEYTLAGSIYNGRVTRVLPGMQSSFVDIGLERDAFLYITDFMEEAADGAEFDSDGKSTGRRDSSKPGSALPPGDAEATPRREGGRGEEGRRGGRGERGRGGREQAARPVDPDQQAFEQAVAGTTPLARELPVGEAGDVGEGEPGADGGRRWRGRRGRRRGRGEDAGATVSSEQTAVQPDASEQLDVLVSEEAPARNERPRRDRSAEARGENSGAGRERLDEVRSRFAPRGTGRGSASREETVDLSAQAEPFILPGESLSKYKRDADGKRIDDDKPAAAPLAAPSTAVEALVGWDGGSVLPGETLSRRGGGSAKTASSGEGRGGRERGGRDRGGRGERNQSNAAEAPRETFAPRAELDPSEAVQPAVTAQHEIEPYEVNPATPSGMAAVSEAEMPAQQSSTEYEPGEKDSASFRVDHVPPSEFRLPWSKKPAEPVFKAEEKDASNEYTAIEPTGEMNSQTPSVLKRGRNAAAPIEHEKAVQSVTEADSERHGVFAPGDGQLEEETMDDDDSEVSSLQARASRHEEHETLEGGADLGVMLREMSIDDRTRAQASSEDDEDDFDIDEQEMEEGESGDGGQSSAGGEPVVDDDGFESSEALDENGAPIKRAPRVDGGRARREGSRDGRRSSRDRGGRDRGRGDSTRDSGGRARSTGGERSHGGRMSRSQAQTANLPAISDLLKPGQELLVQIAKEPIAKKGARITSHIALPGRFLVFMPTVSHTGVSRKIESDAERRRLKEILLSERGEASGGFIVRTAAEGASEEELRSDLRFLLNLWTDIKTRSESSKSPALIYHDLNLVERILRDQVTDDFSAIWVDTEDAYERVLRFLQRFQPSLIRRVKLYTKETPLFEHFGVNAEIDKALRSKVWLKSGGSIVINQTEALVAIDINTGKYVGKTARLEDTIVKTNLDAIPEIVRQIRLRDLGGIIIIDFIDMDDRKNRHKVLAALEEELKSDRAPSKVLPFNDFGLIAITRKRVKQSLERTLSTTCGVCQGTGMTKSPVTVANDIYIEMRKMQKHLDRGDVMLRVHPEVVKQLKSPGTKWLQEMEEMVGKTILVKSDPSLHPEQFDIH